AAEAREWLAENEDDTAMTPERLAALEAEAADAEAGGNGADVAPAPLDEASSPVSGRRFTRA
ncbi:MAG: 4-hydroxy-3-methylbut-2-en-1-yl diphosphate synthase, partial [Solirubrobacteraceae bacterium]